MAQQQQQSLIEAISNHSNNDAISMIDSMTGNGMDIRLFMFHAVKSNNVSVVQKLLECGVKIDEGLLQTQQITPLMLAVQNDSPLMIRFLLNACNASFGIRNAENRNAFEIFFMEHRFPNVDIFRVFISYFQENLNLTDMAIAHLLQASHCPLALAADLPEERAIRVITLLVDRGMDIDLGADLSMDNNEQMRRNALQIAVIKSNFQLAHFLIARGANVNTAFDDGVTPLHLASSRPHIEMLRLLLSNGANPNTQNTNEISPLINMIRIGAQRENVEAFTQGIEELLVFGGIISQTTVQDVKLIDLVLQATCDRRTTAVIQHLASLAERNIVVHDDMWDSEVAGHQNNIVAIRLYYDLCGDILEAEVATTTLFDLIFVESSWQWRMHVRAHNFNTALLALNEYLAVNFQLYSRCLMDKFNNANFLVQCENDVLPFLAILLDPLNPNDAMPPARQIIDNLDEEGLKQLCRTFGVL